MHHKNTISLVLIALLVGGCDRPPKNAPATKEAVVQAARERPAEKAPSIQWTNEQVLEAIQRGTSLPSHVTVSAVEFKTNESVHPDYAMAGSVTFRFEADTYRSVGDFSYKSHYFTQVKKVRSKGDTISTEFQSRLSAESVEQARISVVTGDWSRQGDLIQNFNRALDVDSENGQKAVGVREQAIAAEKKLGGISHRASFAVTLRELITEEELAAPRDGWWGALRGAMEELGYKPEGDAVFQLKSKLMPPMGVGIGTRNYREQAVALVKPEILADADRLVALRDRLQAELRAAERFFSEEL